MIVNVLPVQQTLESAISKKSKEITTSDQQSTYDLFLHSYRINLINMVHKNADYDFH